MKTSTVLLIVLILACCAKVKGATPEFMSALRHVESGGQPNGGRDVTADNGTTIGPLCISRAAWLDSRILGSWEDCRDYDYACRVAMAYWQRYCPAALANKDYETLARVWNGGPKGATKKATIGYWKRVQAAMR